MAQKFNKYILPENWIWVQLGEVLETTSGGTPSRNRADYYGGNIPWVKSGELNYGIITKTEEHITDEALRNSSAKLFPKGTLLIALYGATVGRLAFLGIDASTNQAVCGIFQNKNIDIKYIYYCLLHQYSFLISLSAGGAQPNISQTIIKQVSIPLPPLSEQNRIVEKLDELFSELEKGKEQLQLALAQLKVYRQAVLKWAFEGKLTNEEVKEGELPKGWKWVKLSSLGSWKGGGTPSKQILSFWEKGKHLWVTPKDMKTAIINDSIDKITDEALINSSATLIKKGAILFVMRSGILRHTFPVSIAGKDLSVNQDLLTLTPNEFAVSEFIYWYIRAFNHDIRQKCTKNGTTVESIESNLLKDYPFILPPLNAQFAIVDEIESNVAICDKLEETITQALQQTEILKQSLLQKAFEGKLVPQDPNDEPAAVLLARITREREEFLTIEKGRKKTKKPLKTKSTNMKGDQKTIIEILQASKEPVPAKTLWQSSEHKDYIDAFYDALKKHIEAGEIIELPREGKESFIKLADAK